ncbi:sentrin-specific protease 2-like [Cyprinodon tularosa]|uniref:sentrin-specific protease 2-like n=1 Tax=Cyprinodon tularosa TaxID=77115 RepID=UPI0018E24581|nr:sentrin-specific protease 2-like [Cyprinodon tularosa]
MELESESINAYLHLLINDYNCAETTKSTFIDTFAMTSIWNGKIPRLKIKPMEYGVILGIVNKHHHWMLVVIYPQDKRLVFLDPLGESKQDIQTCRATTRAFMRKMGCNISRWTCDTVMHPKQTDATSCGLFTLKFAEKILRKEKISFPTTKKEINKHRMKIATTLLLSTDDLSNLCHFCGEKNTDIEDIWIQCDDCFRWYHLQCVGNPDPQQDYVCFACQ